MNFLNKVHITTAPIDDNSVLIDGLWFTLASALTAKEVEELSALIAANPQYLQKSGKMIAYNNIVHMCNGNGEDARKLMYILLTVGTSRKVIGVDKKEVDVKTHLFEMARTKEVDYVVYTGSFSQGKLEQLIKPAEKEEKKEEKDGAGAGGAEFDLKEVLEDKNKEELKSMLPDFIKDADELKAKMKLKKDELVEFLLGKVTKEYLEKLG
jgi:hypothetical protein